MFAIKIYYRYLQETEQRKDHPCQKLYLKDQVNRAIAVEKLYTKNQLETLLTNYQTKNQSIQLRDEVIISLLIHQALLVKEITSLKVAEVNLEKGEIFIEKGGKTNARTLPLQANQILLFYNYLEAKKNTFRTYQKTNSILYNFQDMEQH